MILAIFTGCSDNFMSENNSTLNEEDFECCFQTIKDIYPFLKFKNINMDSLYAVYKPRVKKANGDEFYKVLYDFLTEFKDKHFELILEGGFPIKCYNPQNFDDYFNLYNPHTVRKYFPAKLKVTAGNRIEYGLLGNNIGYLYLTNFPKFSESEAFKQDFFNALEDLSFADGLILDLRNNTGGEFGSGEQEGAGMFTLSLFASKSYTDTLFARNSNIQRTYIVSPNRDFTYEKAVVVLINKYSVSCAEFVSENMRRYEKVTLIGDTTAGAGGANYEFSLPSGKSVNICKEYGKRVDRKLIEWNGILPDIVVENKPEEISNGIDKQLEKAIEFINFCSY